MPKVSLNGKAKLLPARHALLPDLCPDYVLKDHTEHGLNQWKTTLHCNIVSHWLSPCPEWFLRSSICFHVAVADWGRSFWCVPVLVTEWLIVWFEPKPCGTKLYFVEQNYILCWTNASSVLTEWSLWGEIGLFCVEVNRNYTELWQRITICKIDFSIKQNWIIHRII